MAVYFHLCKFYSQKIFVQMICGALVFFPVTTSTKVNCVCIKHFTMENFVCRARTEHSMQSDKKYQWSKNEDEEEIKR